MRLRWETIALTKRVPLTISRGTITGSTNVIVQVEHEGVTGIGEAAPSGNQTGAQVEADLLRWSERLTNVEPWGFQEVERVLGDDVRDGNCLAPSRAALDAAMHDWLGRRTGLPCWTLLGLDARRIPPTSVTIGITDPALVGDRVTDVLDHTGTRVLKIKLGSPSGTDVDREMFVAAQRAAEAYVAATGGASVEWRVDANGGWSPSEAVAMIEWLAARGVGYVEQPLARNCEHDLPYVYARRSLPIFVDESVEFATDVPALADRVDGVNLKLMKTGGMREAVRLIHTARACNLRVMIGCMGESSLSITAGAHLSPLVDYVDLDSHLNLVDDPFDGARWDGGVVRPNQRPGLGVARKGSRAVDG